MNRGTPGLPVHHQLPESTQTHAHWVSDAIRPSHPLSSPSPPAPNPSQHQGLFKWVNSSHQVAEVLEFQLQHQSFQWTPRTDLLQDGLVGSLCSPTSLNVQLVVGVGREHHTIFSFKMASKVILNNLALASQLVGKGRESAGLPGLHGRFGGIKPGNGVSFAYFPHCLTQSYGHNLCKRAGKYALALCSRWKESRFS